MTAPVPSLARANLATALDRIRSVPLRPCLMQVAHSSNIIEQSALVGRIAEGAFVSLLAAAACADDLDTGVHLAALIRPALDAARECAAAVTPARRAA